MTGFASWGDVAGRLDETLRTAAASEGTIVLVEATSTGRYLQAVAAGQGVLHVEADGGGRFRDRLPRDQRDALSERGWIPPRRGANTGPNFARHDAAPDAELVEQLLGALRDVYGAGPAEVRVRTQDG
ncbi:hypothetical protein WIS52_14820 [Pseudonocardia nematodicida]|uniref:TY-Chap N-terminal domain-containing protein n=1 Tax=Pseudonocardia nematodicida TaxID=1206997 RepID=A0ABV1KB90_9PSEU